jgi:hypothetical protein
LIELPALSPPYETKLKLGFTIPENRKMMLKLDFR